MGDLLGVAGRSVLGAILFALLAALTHLPPPNPALPIIHALTLLTFLGTPRVIYRGACRSPHHRPVASDERRADRPAGRPRRGRRPVPPRAGAGPAAAAAGRRACSPRPRQTGRRIQGRRSSAPSNEAAAVLERLGRRTAAPTMVVVTPDCPARPLARLLAHAERARPDRSAARSRPTALHPAADSRGGPLELKPVAIEDLLNRPQVPLDREGMARLIQGRRVIVTGAGGTIGSELARQVAALRPRARSSCSTTANTRCGRSTWSSPRPTRRSPRRAMIADIRDEARIRAIFDDVAPRAGVPRRRAEARADGGGEPAGGAADQRRRHPPRRRRGARGRGAGDGADLHRQGGEPDQRDGRLQAAGGDVLPGAGHRGAARPAPGMRCVTVRFGNVLGSTGSRRAAVPAPARARRPADRHPSRHAALLHDGARGGRPRAAGQRARRRRRRRCRPARTAASSCSTWASR